jgi:hypothetical protein
MVMVGLVKAEFGIDPAATVSEGVVVEFETVGTSHEGHDSDGAVKRVTVPVPPPDPPAAFAGIGPIEPKLVTTEYPKT